MNNKLYFNLFFEQKLYDLFIAILKGKIWNLEFAAKDIFRLT